MPRTFRCRIYRSGVEPAHQPHTDRTSPVPARAGVVRRVPVPVSPAACTFVLAPRRFRVPDLNHSKSRLAEVGNLHLC